MPLQDHFHPPLSTQRHWHSFHNAWATYLSSDLNRRLPQGYFAEANVQFSIEIEVAAFEEGRQAGAGPPAAAAAQGVTTVAVKETWSPPAPAFNVPFAPLTEVVEVRLFDGRSGPTLAGVIELVSPANKDRPAHRAAFVGKCATYLRQGVGLVMVDVVTERGGNLHAELLALLAPGHSTALTAELYTAAYRPIEREGQPTLDTWQEALAVGAELPTLPLWLCGGLCLPVELEPTYERTCREQRLTFNGD
jgi:hypothetical protein